MKARTLLPGLLLGCALTTDARADGWSAFEAAFPMFPCQDGWMGCMVGVDHIDPELRRDDAGRPVPSDARIGWFDLKATPSFSPFVGLSVYSDEVDPGVDDAVAVAEVAEDEGEDEEDGVVAVEEPVRDTPPDERVSAPSNASGIAADQAAAEAEAARAANLTAQREQKEAEARRREADALAKEQKVKEDAARKAAADAVKKAALVNAAAAADERARLDGEAAAATQKAADLERERKLADADAETRRAAELAAQQKAAAEQARQKEAEQARLAAEEKDRDEKARLAKLQAAEALAIQQKNAEAKRLADEKEAAKLAAAAPAPDTKGVTPVPVPGGAVPTVADGECADTSKLEPISLLGKLTDGTMQCLETRLVNAPKMTDKKKISGLLMTDAWAKGDKERWETLIKRHLDDIDQSDPDLCYKYALHLSRQGPGRASGVIRWANVALENRTVWIGDTYTSRVNSLYKVRAAASQSLWQQAETEHAATPGEETKEKVEKYRNMTKVNAREWFEYAKSSGKDSSTALQLCMSAAGTADYCEAN